MPRPSSPRLLLLLPTTTYRTAAFVEAARRLGVALTVASDEPSTFESSQPAGLLTLDFAHLDRAVEQAAVFAREHPIAGVVGVDDDTAVLAAVIVERLSAAGELKGNPVTAALAARDKHRQRVLLAEHGEPCGVLLERMQLECRRRHSSCMRSRRTPQGSPTGSATPASSSR